MRAWAEMFNDFLASYDGAGRHRRRTPTPTTSPTSTASPATTGSATSSPRAASRCPRAPTTARRETVVRARQPQERRVQRGARARRRRRRTPARCCCSTTCATSACRSRSSRRRSTPRRCSPPPGSPTASPPSSSGAVADRARPARASRRPTRSCTPPTVLGATAATSVVLEDAVSGVRAGAAGDFGLVIGVDRGAGADALTAAGADRRRRATSPSSSRRRRRMNGHARRTGPARPRPLPGRPVGAGRDRLPARRPRASPRRCSRSPTATSACAATPRRGATAFAHGTFVNGFHETWPIRHAEAAFGFARPARRSSTSPTPS